jgi:hypothetical protein
MTPPSSGRDNGLGRRVTVHLPDAREHVWNCTGLAMTSWEIGDVVRFRNTEWRVVGRHDGPEALTLTLAADDDGSRDCPKV